jgi:hypothetical protein
MIVLLDLNFTLVENSNEKLSPFTRQIDNERYSAPLINLIKDHTVLLVTARPAQHRKQTLESIKLKTGWLPHNACFNEWRMPPAQCKEKALQTYIFPKYGDDPANYLAIESNPHTRDMYARYGIASVKPADAKNCSSFEELNVQRPAAVNA